MQDAGAQKKTQRRDIEIGGESRTYPGATLPLSGKTPHVVGNPFAALKIEYGKVVIRNGFRRTACALMP